MKKRIGFIGVGLMGNWMARHLLSAGFSVVVHDIDPAKVDAIVERRRGKGQFSRPDSSPGRRDHDVLAQFNDRL